VRLAPAVSAITTPTDLTDRDRRSSAHRKAQGLTQREFADIAGVGVRFVSELERGKSTAEVGLVLEVLANAGYDLFARRRGWTSREGDQ
jgi:transcriptional regulator with XRE-family HTH domain